MNTPDRKKGSEAVLEDWMVRHLLYKVNRVLLGGLARYEGKSIQEKGPAWHTLTWEKEKRSPLETVKRPLYLRLAGSVRGLSVEYGGFHRDPFLPFRFETTLPFNGDIDALQTAMFAFLHEVQKVKLL